MLFLWINHLDSCNAVSISKTFLKHSPLLSNCMKLKCKIHIQRILNKCVPSRPCQNNETTFCHWHSSLWDWSFITRSWSTSFDFNLHTSEPAVLTVLHYQPPLETKGEKKKKKKEYAGFGPTSNGICWVCPKSFDVIPITQVACLLKEKCTWTSIRLSAWQYLGYFNNCALLHSNKTISHMHSAS